MSPVPFWSKIFITLHTMLMLPLYTHAYGLVNFLYVCDAALLWAFYGAVNDDALFLSSALVGVLVSQFVWCLDLAVVLFGHRGIGLALYMTNPDIPWTLRALSLFHAWLPAILLWWVGVYSGYDVRAFHLWSGISAALGLVSYWSSPECGGSKAMPRNINKCFGPSDEQKQTQVHPWVWLVGLNVVLTVVIYYPTHILLSRILFFDHLVGI